MICDIIEMDDCGRAYSVFPPYSNGLFIGQAISLMNDMKVMINYDLVGFLSRKC